jgi:type IV pilus assembly protein PilW
MRRVLHSRGFTLVELLIGAAVGSIVMLGISMTFIAQAQQYQSHASRRAIQASARQSLAFMDRKIRAAGYGVNPDRAVLAYDSYDVVSDSAVPGYPDAVVVHSRDPLFRRILGSAAPNQLVLRPDQPPLSEPMRKGQILLVLCNLATEFAFVTVDQYLPVGTTTIPIDQADPNTAPNSPTQGPGRSFREHARLNNTCFDKGDATVVMINRSAFYVAMFDDDGDPATNGRTPFLMMHQGLDMPSDLSVAGDGEIDANDAVPVAEGIEQLQVAYIMNVVNPLLGFPPPPVVPIIVGVEEVPMLAANHYGEEWQRSNAAINGHSSPKSPPTPWYFDTDTVVTDHPLRRLDHPANIRQIRLTVVARSTVSDQQITGDNLMTGAQGVALANGAIPWRQLENLAAPVNDFNPTGGGYYRVLLRESITPKNMQMNAQFPPVSFLNVNARGGG